MFLVNFLISLIIFKMKFLILFIKMKEIGLFLFILKISLYLNFNTRYVFIILLKLIYIMLLIYSLEDE